jgi:hypothetical protein
MARHGNNLKLEDMRGRDKIPVSFTMTVVHGTRARVAQRRP